ncbi:BspA family leucine-rich repeat surface protein [Mycoplasma yeatsii]|uniref:BspA family leucine-rich repeat surface protein n=1 Tax=Mycoplasma yeatsii TaxID=51365 RepID=UPI0005B25166|nr:BspA family leucine-rich repeat surface protein [Mycoplasma yeatsii]AJM71937.1 PARCEL domain containing lipoprotein [Mycoplasma yeatsii GM274B]
MKKLLSFLGLFGATISTSSTVVACNKQENPSTPTDGQNNNENHPETDHSETENNRINLNSFISQKDLGEIKLQDLTDEKIIQKIKDLNPLSSEEDFSKFLIEISEYTAKITPIFNNLKFKGEVTVRFIPIDEQTNGREAVYNKEKQNICEKIGYFKNESGKWQIRPLKNITNEVPKKLPWFISDLSKALENNVSSSIKNLDKWDTSNVTNMSLLFKNASKFNQKLNFNTSNVTNMQRMFEGASSFNQELDFDTRNVTDMSYMFLSSFSFNQQLNFNTSNVTNMSFMFSGATRFNQALSFNTSNVTNMSNMFKYATNFNKELNFNTSNVTDMSYMFNDAFKFNQSLSFDTLKVTNMEGMFKNASDFNSELNFNTSNVTNMSAMFYEAESFNQDISSWDVNNVTSHELFASVKENKYHPEWTNDKRPTFRQQNIVNK